MSEAEPLVVGVDGGGTSTRCLIATTSGEILSRGRAGGANPRSARDPGGNLARALAEALAGVRPGAAGETAGDVAGDVAGRVVGGVFGLAGASETGRKEARALAAAAWRAAGLPGLPEVVPDVVVAFAGATPEPSGGLILSGTGAVAARMEDRRIARRCDGYGWLLGDEGSGVWIGRRAVQAALASLDGRGAPTVLTERVLATLEGAPAAAPRSEQALIEAYIAAVYDHEPARLGIISPVVEAAAREGDRVALAILDDAARRLVATLDAVGPLDPALPVVLAGSLLTQPTLVAERVRDTLRGRPLALSLDGAAGAAALALRAAPEPAPGAAEAAHRRLLAASTAPLRSAGSGRP
ncbi:BadF/BadG/BcrA/BcrD ATPase family protein [Sphaerisporangium sp. NPDC051017]|uniref:N-acetylglucosamine kinase n=1 Tax=Sphaerisporangium sp. NPDC051017 TaxID=3154636 RepID=UPI00341B561A